MFLEFPLVNSQIPKNVFLDPLITLLSFIISWYVSEKKTVLQNIERIQLLWICNDALPSRACMPWYGVVVTHIIWLSMPMQLFLDSSWNSYWCSNSCNAMIDSKGIFRDCEGCSVAFSFQYSLCIFAQTGIKLVKKANYPRDLSVLYFSISVHVTKNMGKNYICHEFVLLLCWTIQFAFYSITLPRN